MKNVFRVNNFDLIRLIAALQVAFHHSMVHLEIENNEWYWFLTDISKLFPGVPIFFFVSGFLISKSYENNPAIRQYSQNRILRIYPALIICTVVSLLSVFYTGYFANISTSIYRILVWIAGQISFIQFYNPDFMRGFGTGVLNGSLWTITVELQFYVLIPILYFIFGIAHKQQTQQTKVRDNVVLIILVLLFMAINIVHCELKGEYAENLLFKMWGVSFSPWFYMFLVGVFFQKNFAEIYQILHNRFYFILLIYVLFTYFVKTYFGWHLGNSINPILYLLLTILIFSFAYSFPTLSNRLLRKNDVSYGVYIYHIPVINLFIYYGYISSTSILCLALFLTIIIAFISWIFIEKSAIKLKKHPFNPLQPVNKSS